MVRQAAENDDVQITFGIAQDDGMADAVKVTVIATGFRVETPMLDAARDNKPFMDQIPAVPGSASAPDAPAIVSEPAPAEEPAIVPLNMDLDDLDTPAYLRQGKHLN